MDLIQSVSFGAFLVLTRAFYVMSKPKRLITCSLHGTGTKTAGPFIAEADLIVWPLLKPVVA